MNEYTWKRQRDSAEKRANMLKIDLDRVKLQFERSVELLNRMPFCECADWADVGTSYLKKGNNHHQNCKQFKEQ